MLWRDVAGASQLARVSARDAAADRIKARVARFPE
jgi:hypothetical protein